MVIAAVAVNQWAKGEIERRAILVNTLQGEAEASTQITQELVQMGTYQLAAVVPVSLVDQLLHQLEGYSQITSKGNTFEVDRVETRFDSGHVELKAYARFRWRLGFYDGPITVTYRGFARVDDLGRCHLDLRVIHVQPDHPLAGLNGWLSPLITLRLQNRLRIPHIELPINYHRELKVPAIREEVRGVAIELPQRAIAVQAPSAYVFCTSDAIGLVVPEAEGPGEYGLAALPLNGDRVTVAMKAAFLNDLLGSYVASDIDAVVTADRVPSVWRKTVRVFGKEYTNNVDIASINGHLDVTQAALQFNEQDMLLKVAIEAHMNGIVLANMLGISAQVPFTVATVTSQNMLPIEYDNDNRAFRINTDDLSIPLDIQLDIGPRQISFGHTLRIDAAKLVGNVTLPELFNTHIKIPTRVEHRKIVAHKELELDVAWEVTLPQSNQGLIITVGDVRLSAGSD